MLPWLSLLACSGETVPDAPVVEDSAVPEPIPETLDAVAWAARASLDLRGLRASAEELQRVEDEPAVLEELVTTWIAEPAFAERMSWRYNDRAHVATHFVAEPYRDFSQVPEATLLALGWEPLEMVRMTIQADQPFSDIVTADWLPRHPAQAALLGWSHAGEGWVPYGPPDERPMAGVLSSTSFWLRYDGDKNNFNRRRANAIADVFLCADFLQRDTSFEFQLAAEDLQDMEEAIRNDQACTTCHDALDPLAASLGGFAERSVPAPMDELGLYSLHDEAFYRGWRSPMWFGTPVGDLSDLGRRLAEDPRFATCAVRTFSEGLLGRELQASDPLLEWTETFLDEDMRVSALAREVVLGPEYGAPEQRTLHPDQLAAVLVGLGLDVDTAGRLSVDVDLKVLAGGSDDNQVLSGNARPSLGHHLALAWAGRELAAVRPAPEGEVREGLAALHVEFLSRAASPEELDQLEALHAAAGWPGVVEGLVRHPEFLIY